MALGDVMYLSIRHSPPDRTADTVADLATDLAADSADDLILGAPDGRNVTDEVPAGIPSEDDAQEIRLGEHD